MPQIRLPATLDQMPKMMDFLHSSLTVASDLMLKVDLVSEELFVNIVSYAYEEDAPGEIEIGFRRVCMDGEMQLCLWMRDWGRPFNPFVERSTPDLDADLLNRPIGGLGVYLIKNSCHHYCYSDADGTNTVKIFFLETAKPGEERSKTRTS